MIIKITFLLCCEVDCPINHVRKSPPQIGVLIERLSFYTQDLSPKNPPKNASARSTIAQRKWTIKGKTSKGKAIRIVGGTASSPFDDQLCTTENSGFSSPSKTSYGSDVQNQFNTSLSFQVKGILLLSRIQRAPNLHGPQKVSERAHLIRPPQRIRSHTRSSFWNHLEGGE